MKNFITVAFLFYFLISYSSDYKFNLLTKYGNNVNEYETLIYSNTNDDSYYLEVYSLSDDNKAALTDLKNKRVHYFIFLDIKGDDGQISHNFKYVKSKRLVEPGLLHTFHYEFKVTERDSLFKTVLMIEWKNKSKKKFNSIYELKIKDFPSNMFPVFRFSKMHPYEYYRSINFNENGIVESCRRLDKNTEYVASLDYIQEVDFLLETKK